jgi:hypothetical protein
MMRADISHVTQMMCKGLNDLLVHAVGRRDGLAVFSEFDIRKPLRELAKR